MAPLELGRPRLELLEPAIARHPAESTDTAGCTVAKSLGQIDSRPSNKAEPLLGSPIAPNKHP